ncbi:MAG: glutamate 5-kinase, partial [Acidimicrobiia bacterium]|nr:glutamate 5-kinase [Acidimicrobiia bacterium]
RGLDPSTISAVAHPTAGGRGHCRPITLVTSGAVAAGLPALGLTTRPDDIPGLQAAAAVGQGLLMERYSRELAERDLVAGQVLLTRDVLAHREQYLHAREALERMLSMGIVPIVNENDTVVVDELRLGDNDRLAAIVAHLVAASMLVILTDTKGLYSGDPRWDSSAHLLDAVRHTDDVLDAIEAGRSGPLGSGGVATKVAAARMAAWSGIPTVVASADEPDVVVRAVAGDAVGTWVEPRASSLSSRKLWIAFGLPSRGRVLVDGGAARALVRDGRSLLPVGVVGVEGAFSAGDAVEIAGPDGDLVGKGRTAMDAGAVRDVMGRHSDVAGGEVIHRDELVVFAG